VNRDQGVAVSFRWRLRFPAAMNIRNLADWEASHPMELIYKVARAKSRANSRARRRAPDCPTTVKPP